MNNILLNYTIWGYILIVCHAKKNTLLKSSEDLLQKESERISKAGTKCNRESINDAVLDEVRALKKTDEVIACCIKYLQKSKENGWGWSSLGQAYIGKGDTKSLGMAGSSFKQASKLTGKMSSTVKHWHFLGPFVIGKSEIDGDPLASFGGIREVAKSRYKKKSVLYSEIATNGEVKWEIVPQPEHEFVHIQPNVAWSDLVNSLGSTGIMEWQGWAISDFAVNENNLNILIQCLGVHTVFVDNIPLTGDVYRRDQFQFSVNLSRGIHTLYIRLRAKGTQLFRCNLDIAKSNYEIHKPHYMPDLYDGRLFSQHVALPVTNQHASKWLKMIKVTVQEQSRGKSLSAKLLTDKQFSIAPGQTRPINLMFESEEDDHVLEGNNCLNIDLKLKLVTSDGNIVYPLTLRCRKRGESFVFTFVDYDSSIQHGAAIEPIVGCKGEEEVAGRNLCPVLLTLHGTTVPAQNQADSYKHMRHGQKEFVFGADHAWVLAPTRHGAHNWEGPGALTAMAALEQLCAIIERKPWITDKASPHHVIFAGHSMGGHGAWHLATHFPDKALALVSLAGWIKKEEYGDSNLFFRHDLSNSYVDTSVKHIMEACISENEADRFVSNLQGISVMARIGSNDRTIHPYFVRRMYRVLKQWAINVTYVEIPGKEHWWWDTVNTNDGGCVNDKQLREFTNSHSIIPPQLLQCAEGSPCKDKHNMYSEASQKTDEFTYTVINPAFTGSMRGIHILQQIVPYRTSTVEGQISADYVVLRTKNVAMLTIKEPRIRRVSWQRKSLKIDNLDIPKTLTSSIDINAGICLEKIKGTWTVCEKKSMRMPGTFGPARTIAESGFVIVIGSESSDMINQVLLEFAVYVANLFFLTSDTLSPIVRDKDLDPETENKYNLIIIGSTEENSYTKNYLDKIPVKIQNGSYNLGSCSFSGERSGLLTLAPHSVDKLALLLLGSDLHGLQDIISLSTPTIPPMTRSPFSNMIPDYVVTGPDFAAEGPGGYSCIGFWDNNWKFDPVLSSCAYCV